jgi:CheY-like chemotaxis protein
MRILLVENSPEWQDSIRRGLPDHEVDMAPSYDEALAFLDVGPEYALAIVDLNLNDSGTYSPLDMLGGDVLEHLRDNYPSTRRIALTGFPSATVHEIFERYDIDDLLLKQSLTIADLRKAVRAEGHAFISYVREDSHRVDELQQMLEAAGVPVWRDTADLGPSDDWRVRIRQAITDNALVFIACFSQASVARQRSYQRDEIILAIEQLRQRRPDVPWLIPVRFDECLIPDFDIGGGRTLTSIQRADLFGSHAGDEAARLTTAVLRILGLPVVPLPRGEPILQDLYKADQMLVAGSIMALRNGALQMLGPAAGDLDLFGLEGAEALGGRWDVLQNYAELAFPRDRPYSRSIIDASYDPAWRAGLQTWAEQNPELLVGDTLTSLPAFDHAVALNLDGYVREFSEASPALEAALAAGRLPCSPGLVARSPGLARLAMCLWRLSSADSSMRKEFVEGSALDSLEEWSEQEELVSAVSDLPRPAPAISPRSHAQAEGDRLEKSVLDVLELLFRLEGGEASKVRVELRRQRPGTQYGTDIIFRARAAGSSSTCLVECKNYTSPLPMSAVADKVLQAEASFDAEPVDHWILISPHQDPSNELDRSVQRWNSMRKFPFTVQIWSPQAGVRDLFAVDPEIYRELYGVDPPEPRDDPGSVVADFAERLRPPIRLSEKLASYIKDKRSFVQPSELTWLDQLDSQIERYGFDEKGGRLSRPLRTEILAVLFNSSDNARVALLLAEFGEGKSFFTVSLCAYLQAQYLAEPRPATPIPVRLFLKGYRHATSPADFLRIQLEQVGLSMEEWPELLRQNVLIILDGLDEMSVQQDPVTTRVNLDKIGSLLELLEGLPVLVTSRPHFFSSGPDRERFYDRLRRPHVFRLAQPDRRETVAHLRAYADSPDLTEKLNRIKELYDPIGVAGKVLFLEMIKQALPDLPEDRFDELVLYEAYVEGSLKRKIQLLRDPTSTLNDMELRQQLEELLERIAVAIHVSGEGSVDLRQFVADAGGAAKLLWRISEAEELPTGANEDAAVRIGGRSLLRRVSGPEKDGEESWLVDFFHRSMKEYFVAKAIERALNAADRFAATRELLIRTPIQPEIVGFFKLIGRRVGGASAILASLAHSARVGAGQGILGGGAISLCYAVDDQTHGLDWKSLDLDGALLAGADLSGTDLRGSTLRGADLSLVNLTGADLREADLTDANLAAGGSIIAFSPESTPHHYICLAPESGLGRIAVKADSSLSFSFISLPRELRSPQNLFTLAEDVVLITGDSEFLIVEIGSGTAEEATHFRIASDIRAVTVLDQSFVGLLLEPEWGQCEALLVNIDSGHVTWRIPVSPNGRAYGWSTESVVIAYDDEMVVYHAGAGFSTIRSDIQPSGHTLSLHNDAVVAVTYDGQAAWIPLDSMEAETVPIHSGTGTAALAVGGDILTAGSDGSVALVRRDAAGGLTEIARLERRLLCAGARVGGLKRERERLIFLANDATDAKGAS